MKTRFNSVFRWRFLAMASFICLSFVLSPTVQGSEKLTVRVDFSPWGVHGALHLAVEKGWFEKEGLDIEVQDGKGTINTIQLVGAGHVDVGQVQLGLMAPARNKGLPVKSFAGWIRRGDLAALVDRKLQAKTVKDLKGLTLVLFAKNPFVPFIDTFLKNGGLDRSEVKIVFVEPATMVGIYTAGKVDGLLVVGPWGLPVVEKARPADPIVAADYGIAFPSYGFMTNEKTLAERPDDLRKLTKVQQKAWKYIYDGNHIDEAVSAIISQRPEANLDRTILKSQLEMYRDYLHTPRTKGKVYGWQSEEDWADAIELMEATNLIEPGSKPSDYFTNEFIEE